MSFSEDMRTPEVREHRDGDAELKNGDPYFSFAEAFFPALYRLANARRSLIRTHLPDK
jgi:hypothetical protein